MDAVIEEWSSRPHSRDLNLKLTIQSASVTGYTPYDAVLCSSSPCRLSLTELSQVWNDAFWHVLKFWFDCLLNKFVSDSEKLKMVVNPSGFKGLEWIHFSQDKHSRGCECERETHISANTLWMSQGGCWCQRWFIMNPADLWYYLGCEIFAYVCDYEWSQVSYVGCFWTLLPQFADTLWFICRHLTSWKAPSRVTKFSHTWVFKRGMQNTS